MRTASVGRTCPLPLGMAATAMRAFLAVAAPVALYLSFSGGGGGIRRPAALNLPCSQSSASPTGSTYLPVPPATVYPPPRLQQAYTAAVQQQKGANLGCWLDRRILRDLDESVTVLNSPTAEVCVAHCEARGTMFAGITAFQQQCWCGDAPLQHGRLAPSECEARDDLSGPRNWLAYTLLRTGVCSPRRAASAVALAGMCAKGFSCTSLFSAMASEYATRHSLELHLSTASLEPALSAAFSKLVQARRLLRMGYEWIWWLDCDTLLLRPERSPMDILRLAFTRYSFTSRLLCTNQSSFHCPPPNMHCPYYCNTSVRLSRNIRPTRTFLLYAIHHTILVMAISCECPSPGRSPTQPGEARHSRSPPRRPPKERGRPRCS